ncbi:hypothetical protein [Streptomyces vastus]|uniref:hypothetical protein n=1 Tax=Streptomyces vastus TaxID=285451 RepID=UPI0031D26BF0
MPCSISPVCEHSLLRPHHKRTRRSGEQRGITELLTGAVAHRELETAGSVSDVLVRRLRRIADLPTGAVEPPSTRPARHNAAASSPGAARLTGQGGAPQGHRR